MGAGHHRRRPNKDCRRIDQSDGEFADVHLGDVKPFDSNTAHGQSRCHVLHHPPRAAVHRNPRQDNEVLRRVRSPVAVGVDDERRPPVYRAVAGADCINRVAAEPFEMFLDKLVERHHNLGVVALRWLIDAAFVGHG